MTKSEEWDGKAKRNTLGNPFSPKVLIGVGILVLLITLLIAFATPPIYAQLFGSTIISGEIVEQDDLDQSYHIAILQSQSLLMDKIDWNNCAISHKGSRSYVYMDNPDTSWGQSYQLYTAYTNNDLIKYCGERP